MSRPRVEKWINLGEPRDGTYRLRINELLIVIVVERYKSSYISFAEIIQMGNNKGIVITEKDIEDEINGV